MRKTKKEIIDETFAYYNEDPSRRGLLDPDEPGSPCCYVTDNGGMCAVGRCLTEEVREVTRSSSLNSSPFCELYEEEGDQAFKEEYRGHPHAFWSDLQRLHDLHVNWTGEGATERALGHVETLHARWDETETN